MPTYAEIRQNLIDPQILRLKEELMGSGISFGRIQSSKLPTSTVVVGGGGGTTDPNDLGFIQGIAIYSGGTLIGTSKKELSFLGAGVIIAGDRATIDIATPLAAKITNPMTTAGDMIYGITAGAPTRRAIGTDGQFLRVVSSTPTWVTIPSGFTNPMSAVGDIIFNDTVASTINSATSSAGASASSSSNYPGYFPSSAIDGNDSTQWVPNSSIETGQWITIDLGTAKTITQYRIREDSSANAHTWELQCSNNNSTWTTVASFSNSDNPHETGLITLTTPVTARYWRMQGLTGAYGWNVYTIELYAVIVTANRLGIGTPGQVLTVTSGYLPAWMTPSGTLSASGFSNPMTTAGDLIYGASAGVATRLPIGAEGRVLTVSGGLPQWLMASGSSLVDPTIAAGDIIYRGVSALERLPIGVSGQILTISGGLPTWQNPITASGTSSADAVRTGTVGAIIPGLAGSADIAFAGGAGTSREFESGDTAPTWSSSPANTDVGVTALSHLYAKWTDTTERFGTYSWAPGSGAFDARCKVTLGTEATSSDEGAVGFIINNSGNTDRLLCHFDADLLTRSRRVRAFTYTGGSYTQRGSTWQIYTLGIYLRITRDGSNNCSFYYSTDGLAWQLIATQSFTLTIANIGFRISGINSNNTHYIFSDWIRTSV